MTTLDGWPPILAALAGTTWTIDVEGDDEDARHWESAALDPVTEWVAAELRAHGVTATELRYFCSDDPYILVAAWSPGDADAVLHEVRIYGGGREIFVRPDHATSVEAWLRELNPSLLPGT